MTQKGIKEALEDEFLDLTRWANNMIQQFRNNYETQHVWPGGFPGPYIGYRNTPAAKKSTGKSYRRMYAKVFNGANGDTKKISFFFNYYLYFVDMGVGAGQPIQKVERSEDARYNKLYQEWKEQGDRQSRPLLAMEVRHQLWRLEVLVSSFYQEFVENGVLVSFHEQLERSNYKFRMK